MYFLWPQYLWLLAVLATLPPAYVWLLRRRSPQVLRYSQLGAVRAAMGGRWRRHLPPVLMLLALGLLLLAAARPVARVMLPWSRSTIMLAIDVSLSMRVNDVQPSRLVAAQEAAKLFLRDLPRDIDVGLVTFAGSSQVAQSATRDREALVAAIDAFQMQMGTAVGDAIVQSLAELFPEHGLDLSQMGQVNRNGQRARGRSLDDAGKRPPVQITPVAPGSYKAGTIILLSDGRRTTGVDTLEAAQLAADRGVRVYVVGLGKPGGTEASWGDGGLPMYLQLDEPTLREVARMTGGEYHAADSAEKLRSVYGDLGSRLQVQTRETEVAGLLALVAALLALTGAGLSLRWFGRMA